MLSHLASAPNINHLWAGLLVEELVRQGTTFFVVCPGSRSTPLAVAVGQNPRAEALVHWDERAAAFVALGWGRATGRPAAVITTSGTAVANLLPAAVEADADGVPLLLITADRPPELRETGANQTVRQPPVFQDVARWALDWPVPTTDVPARWVLSTAAHAAHRATAPPGPVHLNLPFREPLGAGRDGTDVMGYLQDVAGWAEWGRRWTSREVRSVRLGLSSDIASPEMDRPLPIGPLLEADRGVIVVGELPGNVSERTVASDMIEKISHTLGWPVLPDVRTPLRLGEGFGSPVVYADLVLASKPFRERHKAEAVLHVGGSVVSKRISGYLAESRSGVFVRLDREAARYDPTALVTDDIRAPLLPALERMAKDAGARPRRVESGAWQRAWQMASVAVANVLDTRLDTLSEPAVARAVARQSAVMVAGASMPIRDVEAFAVPSPGTGRRLTANRGASGIDGTVATAVGYARGLELGAVSLLIGDLALLHDLTSLSLLREGTPVVVVVINNDGGGIFHRLPIAGGPQAGGAGALDGETFERFFGTPHGLGFEDAACLFSLTYHAPATLAEFESTLRSARESGASALIEVRTDREEQATLRRQIEAEVVEAVDSIGPPWGPLP